MKSTFTKMALLLAVAFAVTSLIAQPAEAGIHNDLIVNNQSHTHVDVYYQGIYVGYVNGHGHAHLHIHDHSGRPFFDLVARDHHGHVWRTHYHGDFSDFTWTLYAPHQ